MAPPVSLLLTEFDKNNDGVTSIKELQSGIAVEWQQFEKPRSAIRFGQWRAQKFGSGEAFPAHLAFDRDFDGKVSKSEFSNRLSSGFERLDKNNDTQLSRAEMLVTMKPSNEGRADGRRRRPGPGP